MLRNKTIVLGVTGGIAAYKALELSSRLVKAGADVKVIMTKSAIEFVSPLSFASITKNQVVTDMFDMPDEWDIKHISLAKAADVFVIAPCTANVIGKIACGIADDMLTTTVMATKAPVLIAPAMNTNMFENPIVQDNIKKLMSYDGYSFVMPSEGRLACGDVGRGKLADVRDIFDGICRAASVSDLKSKKIVISAGATCESLDPVRFITNHSSGKMGFSIAKAAYFRGADVTLVAGRNTCRRISGVKQIDVLSAEEMREAVLAESADADIIIMSAAVSDYRPETVSDEKIKKSENTMTLKLIKNPDILKELGEKYGDAKQVIGFAMETQNLIENAQKKCSEKNAAFIVANNLKTDGAGFGTETNVASIIDKNGSVTNLQKMTKFELANIILDRAVKNLDN